MLAVDGGAVVKLQREDHPYEPERVLGWLAQLPFEIASFAPVHAEWLASATRYWAPGFGDLHFSHGWACAFKGAGHDRLVSRRWLEFGPWRLLRGANDTTLVQFHALDADAATALAQARPSHERMGISDVGGFVQTGYVYANGIEGLYVPEERKLKITAFGRAVPQREMLDVCAARHDQALGPERPIDKVAYVFAEEREAREHLHELWLREIECWTFVDSIETRIDVVHTPQRPEPPGWAR